MRVVVNGCFDLLHPGHVKLLQAARSYPNSNVLVLIDSDRRVRELKGDGRPVIKELDRAFMLWSLRWVDRVEIFDSDEELEQHIKNFSPDVMVKGSHYRDQKIIGQEYCKELKFVDINEKKYSTTSIIQNIIDRR